MSETPEPTSTAEPKTLSKAEWAEAKALYEAGKMTKVDLAKKFGVHRNTMTAGLNGLGAVYGARSSAIEDATIEAAKGDSQKIAEEIGAMKERRKQAIELIDKLQNKTMAEALRDGKPLASKADEFRTLNTLMKNAKLIREELWAIYGLDRDPDGGEEIPEFIVSEYTPDEVDMINRERLGIEPEQELERLAAEAEEVPDELDALLDGTD